MVAEFDALSEAASHKWYKTKQLSIVRITFPYDVIPFVYLCLDKKDTDARDKHNTIIG